MGDIQFLSFELTKGHPDKRMIDHGFVKKNSWFINYNHWIIKCAKQDNTFNGNLIDISGIFLLLGIGYSAAFLSLFCEIVFSRR